MTNGELEKKGSSAPVAPGRTTSPSNIVTTALADLAAGYHHPAPLSKPVAGLSNSLLSNALKAAREMSRPGQPRLAVRPEWDELDLILQPVSSLC